MLTCKAENVHVPKATHIRHFQQSLLGEMQVVVRLDGNALLLLLTLQQPVQADHIPLLLHMRTGLEVFVRGYEVCHVLGPVLIHLNSRTWHVARDLPFFFIKTVQPISCLWLSTDVYERASQQQPYCSADAAQDKAHVATQATAFDSKQNDTKALKAPLIRVTCVSSTAQANDAIQLAQSMEGCYRLTVPPSFLTNASISCLLCWP